MKIEDVVYYVFGWGLAITIMLAISTAIVIVLCSPT
jgi:hypothetical protein